MLECQWYLCCTFLYGLWSRLSFPREFQERKYQDFIWKRYSYVTSILYFHHRCFDIVCCSFKHFTSIKVPVLCVLGELTGLNFHLTFMWIVCTRNEEGKCTPYKLHLSFGVAYKIQSWRLCSVQAKGTTGSPSFECVSADIVFRRRTSMAVEIIKIFSMGKSLDRWARIITNKMNAMNWFMVAVSPVQLGGFWNHIGGICPGGSSSLRSRFILFVIILGWRSSDFPILSLL